MKKIIVSLATLSTALLFSASAWADCSFDRSSGGAMSFPELTVGRILSEAGQPIGHIFGEVEVSTPSLKLNCSGSNSLEVFYGAGLGKSDTVPNAYITSVPGVGVIVEITEGSVTGFMSIDQPLPIGKVSIDKVKLTLVKISNERPEGQLNPTSDILFHVLNSLGRTEFMRGKLGSNYFRTTACDVRSTRINVPMGTTDRDEFTGVGSVTNPVEFSIPMSCFAGTKVKYKIDATQLPGVPGVMSLNPITNSATGVAIKLTRNDAPVNFGVETEAGTTSINGNFDVEFNAQYYQTSPRIKAGRANGTATFTMTYN
ncbi:fimbrial protein [Pseudomonas alkylphenolica]|uniref:fimbrial protein n=1 Tax=Pseudomonas alkylphenolica TaxID=237609 RepID=UPI0018D7B2BE|nr:fimbrial protein [Pseudomonas alkylphenolica]MBH3428902.1 fimbrial protein [Pseudomonas alkylphenolica]